MMKTIDDLAVAGQRVLVRDDLNAGTSLLEPGQVDLASGYLAQAARAGVAIVLPSDFIVATEPAAGAPHQVVAANAIPGDRMGVLEDE